MKNEHGFALVTVLASMLIMVFLGVAALMTSTTEKEIANIDKVHNDTFYQAEGGTNLATELLEQNVNCAAGFTKTDGEDAIVQGVLKVLGQGNVPDHVTNTDKGSLDFWQNPPPDRAISTHYPTDTNRDFFYPADAVNGPHTNFVVGGNTVLAQGSALTMAAGYEGKGKGEAAGGAHIVYQVMANRIGLVNSSATVCTEWRHVVGTEGPCEY